METYANPNRRPQGQGQRIEGEIIPPRGRDRPREGWKRYAELAGNCKNQRIKSLWGNNLKSRSLVADACMLACKKIWLNDRWVSLVSSDDGEREGAMIISTELDEDEVRSLMLSFISGVNEEKIVTSEVTVQERERILLAAEEIKAAPLYVKVLPNFTVSDVENAIKRSHIKDGCNYFFYDYLGTSLGILEEVSRRTRGVSMREDSILFLLATRLKELAVQYNIFIESATQLSAEWKTSQTPDQNLLRGAKSIADKMLFKVKVFIVLE